jgi:hypothetical protein
MVDITEMCLECKNFFLKNGSKDIHSGAFTISAHTIAPLDFLIPGQYFRVTGSVLNDGVYQNTAEGLASLKDETFEGNIWAMAVPPAFLKLCEEIDEWQKKYGTADSNNMSPYQSESIAGVYSYSKASGGGSSNSGESTANNWQGVYKSRLNKWRRISIL